MKLSVNSKQMRALVFTAGAVAALLRSTLYKTGTDPKGLLISGHYAAIAVWVLTGLVAALIVMRTLTGDSSAEAPASPVSHAAGCFLGAAAFVLTASSDAPFLRLPLLIVTVLSCAALVWAGICHLKHRTPHFLCYFLVCVCFALRIITQYKSWSSNPQSMDYVFFMLAHVSLMLTSYYFSSFHAGLRLSRALLPLGYLGAYLSLVSLHGAPQPAFLILCSLWMLLCLPPQLPWTESPEEPFENNE